MILTLTDEELEDYARQGLQRPDNYARFTDLGQYETHAPCFTLAINSGEILDESNYAVASAELAPYLDVNSSGDDDAECDVYDARSSHWAVGPIDQLFVRAYAADGSFTDAWRVACEMLSALKDYPVLDESDYSERETEAFDAELDEALERVTPHEFADGIAHDYVDGPAEDTDEESAEIRQEFYTMVSNDEISVSEDYRNVDWEAVAEGYLTARNAYFDRKAQEIMRANDAWFRDLHYGGLFA